MRFEDLPVDVMLEISGRVPLEDAAMLAMSSKLLAETLGDEVARRLADATAAADALATVARRVCEIVRDGVEVLHHETAWKRAGVVPDDAVWTVDPENGLRFRLGDVRLSIGYSCTPVSWWTAPIDTSTIELQVYVDRGSVKLDSSECFSLYNGAVPSFRETTWSSPEVPSRDAVERAIRRDGSAAWVEAAALVERYEREARRFWKRQNPPRVAKRLLREAMRRRFQRIDGAMTM